MRVLLIDTCGEASSLALAEAGEGTRNGTVASEELPARAASAMLLSAIKRLLASAGWELEDLEGVGVVSGPGSFTGVRAGLAAAKGICEARALLLAAVSRLQVLAEAAGLDAGFAVLDAARGELYVREVRDGGAREFLMSVEDLVAHARNKRIVIAEERLLTALSPFQPELRTLNAAAALPAVERLLLEGGSDLETVDANYVRSERQIYGKTSPAQQETTAP